MNQLEILTIHVKCFVEILTLAQFSGRQKGLFDTRQSRTLPHSSMIVSKKYTTPPSLDVTRHVNITDAIIILM